MLVLQNVLTKTFCNVCFIALISFSILFLNSRISQLPSCIRLILCKRRDRSQAELDLGAQEIGLPVQIHLSLKFSCSHV